MKKDVKKNKPKGKTITKPRPKPAPTLKKSSKKSVKTGATKKTGRRMAKVRSAKPAAKSAPVRKKPPAKPAAKATSVRKKPPAKPAARVKPGKELQKKKPAKATKTAGAVQRPKVASVRHASAAKKQKKPAVKAAEETPEKAPKPLKTEKAEKAEESDKALVKFDPLQRYLSEISKYRLLTRDEERDYGVRVKEQADKDAAYVLVTANLRLVVKIALEFQRVWMQNLLDLIQEGNIGLMQAVKKFDPYKNVKFSYYASFWIKAYILKFIMDNWRLVKIGTTQGQRKLFFKLKKEKQRLIEQGFDPKPKLLSERLGVSEREIVDMDQRLDSWDVSLDAPLKNDSETERIEFLSTENESVEEQVSKKEIELLLHNKITEFRKKMSPREIEIFELRIFSDNPVTLQEIGDRYGISRERVRQIEKNIIRKMREFFKREIPDFASYSEDTGME
jgi:RNA polymerase sigma-32 factor